MQPDSSTKTSNLVKDSVGIDSLSGVSNKTTKADTSHAKIATPGNVSSLPEVSSLQSREDSLRKLLKANKFAPHIKGTASLGYDYGIIPFAANTDFPLGYYKTDGNFSLDALGLPVNVSYYYSSLKNIAGLNNYFRVSFDERRYKEKLSQLGGKSLEQEKDKLGNLQKESQALQQKLAYAELVKQYMPSADGLFSQLQTYKSKYNTQQFTSGADSLKNLNGSVVNTGTHTISAVDSLKNKVNFPVTVADSLIKSNNYKNYIPTSYNDSIAQVTHQLHQYDSVTRIINQYKHEIQQTEDQIKSAKKKIEVLENPEQVVQNNPYMKKTQQFMSGVKKLDVGLCYPNYSTFLLNGSTVKGVNFEWEKKYYFAFTYGKTINTVLTTNNIIQNQLQTAQNLYNFFDFNSVRDSRKILAIKFGLGKKGETHLHAGILYGTGFASYVGNPWNNTIENNIVLELDGKYVLNQNSSVDLVYGKSALYQGGLIETPETPVSRTLFSGFRSNAAMAKYNLLIPKTKTKITAMGRMIDPFFKSYGVGFMRSDNMRYEIKVEQPINSRIKFAGFYRRDQDNLLNTYLYTTSLQTLGTNLTVKVSRRFTARVSFCPVLQQVSSKDNSYSLHNMNNISTVVLTYAPRLRKITTSFNGLYSYYKLTTSGKNTDFKSMSLTNSTMFNSFVKTNLSANWFLNNAGDSLNNGTVMGHAEISFTGRKGASLTVGGKYAYNKVTGDQEGGLVRINVPVIKHLSLEFQAERLVTGDFYSSFYQEQMKKFPYYGYGKINFSW